MKLPKNIATMTDKERYDWYCSLSAKDAESVKNKTFRQVEYAVYANGDLQENYDTLEAAKVGLAYFVTKGYGDCEIERWVNHYNVVDCNLEDREMDHVKT